MKRTAFFLTIATFAGFALPGWATIVNLSPATITTSLDQCESQSGGPCGVNPATAGVNSAPLSTYTTETVGTGAFVSASGFNSPTLTADVPTSVANAIVLGNLQYLLEVVPTTGPSGGVLLGVNSTGSISVNTSGTSPGDPTNDANEFTLIQLQLSSDSSGTPVFNDEVSIVYNAGTNNQGACVNIQNTSAASSTIAGVATLNTNSVTCGSSSVSGGFHDTNSYTVQTGDLYVVTMEAALAVGCDNPGGLSGPPPPACTVEGLATVDPIFTVPSGYTLELSSGVGNSAQTSGVPEPATWTMLAAGMGFLIVAKRRRANRASRDGARAQ